MKIAIVGQGAREHALAWKLRSSVLKPEVWVVPGHGLSRREFPCLEGMVSVPALADQLALESFDLVVVGPEAPLAEGLADELHRRGVSCFGPSKQAAQLESSKQFAKNIMAKAGIPTAAFEICQNAASLEPTALRRLHESGSVVIKADGLAGGKGVFVCMTEDHVRTAVRRLSEQMQEAAKSVVLEDCLMGREVSFFYMVHHHVPSFLGSAVDYKRLLDQDQGPNTGGMGCYTPVPWLPADAEAIVTDRIVGPLMQQLKREGIEYHGFLYVGIMWTQSGPSVVEFNCRLGDPEAQVLTMSDQRDWLPMLLGQAAESQPARPAVATVMASRDYPFGEGERVQHPVPSMPRDHDVAVFAAAITSDRKGGWLTGSGRVFTVVGLGDSHFDARLRSLEMAQQIHQRMPSLQFRRDIASNVGNT